MHLLAAGDSLSGKMQKNSLARVENTGSRESSIEFCEKQVTKPDWNKQSSHEALDRLTG
jgi:hypothetical protein